MRTAAKIEEANAQKQIEASDTAGTKQGKYAPGQHPNSRKALEVTQWVPGVSGNPAGRARQDVGAEIARAVLENNQEAVYNALSSALLKGNFYGFKELCDRGWGKLKEKVEVTHLHEDVADADLESRLKQLERDLGYADAIDQAGRVGIAQAGATETAESKEDTSVLPR